MPIILNNACYHDKKIHPAFSIDPKVNGDTLVLNFPPIRPAKYFRITYSAGLNPKNMETLFKLNKQIMVSGKCEEDVFTSLRHGTSDAAKIVGFQLLNTYNMKDTNKYTEAFLASAELQLYQTLIDSPTVAVQSMNLNDIHLITDKLAVEKIDFTKTFMASRMIMESTWKYVSGGYLSVDYNEQDRRLERFDFRKDKKSGFFRFVF